MKENERRDSVDGDEEGRPGFCIVGRSDGLETRRRCSPHGSSACNRAAGGASRPQRRRRGTQHSIFPDGSDWACSKTHDRALIPSVDNNQKLW